MVFGGFGLARTPQGTLLVPFTLPGETAEVEVVKRGSGTIFAEVVQLRSASLSRVKAPCQYFEACGGCSYQHATYQEQLDIKLGQVVETLQRLGRLESPPVSGIEPSPLPFAYRNRITVHAHRGTIGFHRKDGQGLLDIKHCLLAEEEVNASLTALRAEGRNSGHFTLRKEGLSRAFHQTNASVAEKLRAWVVERVPQTTTRLIDAYCGVGFFGRGCRGRFDELIGIDRDLFNIEEARIDTMANECYECSSVEETLPDLIKSEGNRVVILDPPREGLGVGVKETLSLRPPEAMIYISCDPATLARDLRDLTGSFHVADVRAFDMFPQTSEIEVGVLLTKR